MFAKLAMAEARLTESKVRPEGPFKITTTVAFGAMWLAPLGRVGIELVLEVRNEAHGLDVIKALGDAGYQVEREGYVWPE